MAERGETKKQSERITVNRNKKKQNKGEIQEIPKKKHRHRLTGSHGCDRAEKIPDEAEAAAGEYRENAKPFANGKDSSKYG